MPFNSTVPCIDLDTNAFGIPDKMVNGCYKVFRKWQKKCYVALRDEMRRIINVQTGAGKSIEIKALALRDIRLGFKIIITVPQKNIATSFQTDHIKIPGMGKQTFEVGTMFDLTDPPEGFNSPTLIDRALQFLRSNNSRHSICVMTHMTYVRLIEYINDNNLKHLLQRTSHFIDEAHHSKIHNDSDEADNDQLLNQLGKSIQVLNRMRTTRITLVTATFFRGDRLDVLPEKQLQKYTRFDLPWDEYLREMCYLKRIKFNILLYKNHPTEAIRAKFNYDGRNLIYIPHMCSSFYQEHDISKYELVDAILKCIAPRSKFHKWMDEESQHVWLEANTKNGPLKVVDLVDDSDYRPMALRYIRDHSTCRANAPNAVIALNMFKEGSDFPLADKLFVIGQRNSLQEMMQMIGRILRDYEGKEEVEINYIMRQSSVNSETVLNDANGYLNAIIMSMLLEDVLAPPIISKGRRGGRRERSETLLFNDPNVSHKVWTEITQQLMAIDLNQVANFNTTVLDTIQFVLTQNDVVVSDKKVQLLHDRFKRLWFKRTRLMKGLNCSDIDIRLINDFNVIKGIQQFTSQSIGKNVFAAFRGVINSQKTDLDRCQLLYDCSIKFGTKYFCKTSKNLTEQYCFRLVHSLRKKQRLGKINQVCVNHPNYKWIFEYNRRPTTLERCQVVYKFSIKVGKQKFNQASKNPEERKIAHMRTNLQQQGKVGKVDPKIITHPVFKWIFEYQKTDLTKCNELTEYKNKTGKTKFSKTSTDIEEKQFGTLKCALRTKHKTNQIDPECLANSDYDWIFEETKTDLSRCKELTDYKNKTGKTKFNRNTTYYNLKLGLRKKHKTNQIDPECLANSDYDWIFEETKTDLHQCELIHNFSIKVGKQKFNQASKNPEERKIALLRNKLRQKHKNNQIELVCIEHPIYNWIFTELLTDLDYCQMLTDLSIKMNTEIFSQHSDDSTIAYHGRLKSRLRNKQRKGTLIPSTCCSHPDYKWIFT